MDRYWIIHVCLALIFALIAWIAWRDLSHKKEIEELRKEFHEKQQDQGEYLLQLFKEHNSKYKVHVQMLTNEQSKHQANDKAMKQAIDGLFDLNNKLIQYISKLENDQRVTKAIKQAKIDQLEKKIQDQKAKLQEYETEIARLERKVDKNYQTTNETLYGIVELFFSEIKQLRQEISQCRNNTISLAEEIQQIKHVLIKNEVIVHSGHDLQESNHCYYRNLGAKYGAIAGEYIGGHAEDMVTMLWSSATSLLAKLNWHNEHDSNQVQCHSAIAS